MITEEQLAAWSQLALAATPHVQMTPETDMPVGLHVRGRSLLMLDHEGLACVDSPSDARLWAAASTIIPALIAELTRRCEASAFALNWIRNLLASEERGDVEVQHDRDCSTRSRSDTCCEGASIMAALREAVQKLDGSR